MLYRVNIIYFYVIEYCPFIYSNISCSCLNKISCCLLKTPYWLKTYKRLLSYMMLETLRLSNTSSTKPFTKTIYFHVGTSGELHKIAPLWIRLIIHLLYEKIGTRCETEIFAIYIFIYNKKKKNIWIVTNLWFSQQSYYGWLIWKWY